MRIEGRSSIEVQGIECATLGHGLQGPVIEHPYFGTQRVIEDLKKFRGWASGRITLTPGSKVLVRDARTGLVNGFAAGVTAQEE